MLPLAVQQMAYKKLQAPRMLLQPSAAAKPALFRPRRVRNSRQSRSLCVHASVWGAPEPFAAPQLSSIADIQQQIDQEFDSMLSPFSSMRQMEQRMQQQFQEMDAQFDRAFADMDKVQRQSDAELERNMRQLQQQEPGVRIERREERTPGSYRYYESIQVRSGSTISTIASPSHATPMFNPMLFAAVVLAGAYAAVTAAFNRNYDLTTYKRQGKWQLVLLWPVLALISKSFRQQFSSALRGEKVKVLKSMEDQSNSSS